MFHSYNERGSAAAKTQADNSVDSLWFHLFSFDPKDDDLDVLIAAVDHTLAAIEWADGTEYLPEIKLTAPQREAMEWAGDPMREFWMDAEEREDEGCGVVVDPVKMTPLGCRVAAVRGVLEDLKYRLLEQYPDVVEEEDEPVRRGHVRAAENAWSKVEETARTRGLDNVVIPR